MPQATDVRILAIICSTRPNRVGPAIASWFESAASAAGLRVQLTDLREFALPMYDEPRHPREGAYAHAHTRRWAEEVGRADAFVFISPEYNHAPAPTFVNALSFLSAEWKYKPAAFVSYGGLSGGLRAVQLAKPMLVALRMVPIVDAVSIHNVAGHIDAIGEFQPTQFQTDAVSPMLQELSKVARALRPLRAPSVAPFPTP
jgi:NAD(P)H-dependent FMN reductase